MTDQTKEQIEAMVKKWEAMKIKADFQEGEYALSGDTNYQYSSWGEKIALGNCIRDLKTILNQHA